MDADTNSQSNLVMQELNVLFLHSVQFMGLVESKYEYAQTYLDKDRIKSEKTSMQSGIRRSLI